LGWNESNSFGIVQGSRAVKHFFPPMKILLIEEQNWAVRKFRSSVQQYKLKSQLDVVSNSEEAVRHLYMTGDGSLLRKVPDMIFIDMSENEEDRVEFVKLIRCDSRFNHTPVFIFSSVETPCPSMPSSTEVYDGCYVIQPFDLSSLFNVFRELPAMA
jgi:CheY-like chemotaxis protein